MIDHCRTFVLFINKTDLLRGCPHEVEQQARQLYQSLIDDLARHGQRHDVSVAVFVGSADTGEMHGKLFAHLIECVLDPEDHDHELRDVLDRPRLRQHLHPDLRH